jgi:hypothetical protein
MIQHLTKRNCLKRCYIVPLELPDSVYTISYRSPLQHIFKPLLSLFTLEATLLI